MVSTDKIRLGVIGMSEGNGHPYSWSAIFNGYDVDAMGTCPFPAIPTYLAKQSFPEDQLHQAVVTHVWTQDVSISEHIARSCNISKVVTDLASMVNEVDAVLLARDDSENHYQFAAPFLKAGLPVYIDKPLAISVKDAQSLFSLQQYDWQIFSCSALKYAPEFQMNQEELACLGSIKSIEAVVPKSWEKYAVHVIDPLVQLLHLNIDEISSWSTERNTDQVSLSFLVNDIISVAIKNTGSQPSGIYIQITGERDTKRLVFQDSFIAFRNALSVFIEGVQQQKLQIPRSETLNVVRIIEMGLNGK